MSEYPFKVCRIVYFSLDTDKILVLFAAKMIPFMTLERITFKNKSVYSKWQLLCLTHNPLKLFSSVASVAHTAFAHILKKKKKHISFGSLARTSAVSSSETPPRNNLQHFIQVTHAFRRGTFECPATSVYTAEAAACQLSDLVCL